jgi:hypothetical protein
VPPHKVKIQLKIFIPVGTAIIKVDAVKYALVSTSNPTVNIWCAQTIKPKALIEVKACTIPMYPNICFFA